MHIPRRAPAGLAALLAGTSTLAAQPVAAAPVAAEEEVRECWTVGLTAEQVAAGETSEVHCDVPLPRRLRSSTVAAIHYAGVNGSGSALQVTGDCSVRVSFGVSDWWNNRISSSKYTICGNIKHFVGDDWTGTNQLLTGTAGQVHNLNATLDDQTSSIGYG